MYDLFIPIPFHPINLRKPRISNLSLVGLVIPSSFVIIYRFEKCVFWLFSVVNGIAGPKIESFDTLLETSLLTPFSRIGQQTVNLSHKIIEDFPGGPVVKNPLTNTGDMGSIPGAGRFHMHWGN